MKIFLSQNEIARRIGLPLATLKSRLAERGIESDGQVVNGSKVPAIVFAADRLELIRDALNSPEVKIQ
jgi:hypothetical protein